MTATKMPTPVLDPEGLYFGDNGRVTCGWRCAGMAAQYSGRTISGQRVSRVTRADAAEFAREKVTLKCEGCGKLWSR